MDFRIPEATKYSPPNTQELQKQFERCAISLIRMIQIAPILHPIVAGPLVGSSKERNERILLSIQAHGDRGWPTARVNAHNRLIRKLDNIRRRIVRHPIHFIPEEILIYIFSFTVDYNAVNYEYNAALAQVCRSWETIVLTCASLWSYLGAPSAAINIHKLLAGSALTDVIMIGQLLKPLEARYLKSQHLNKRSLEVLGRAAILAVPINDPLRVVDPLGFLVCGMTYAYNLEMPNTCEGLRLETLSSISTFDIFAKLYNLRHLSLYLPGTFLFPEGSRAINIPALRTLELAGVYAFDFLKRLVAPRLGTLHLSFLTQLKDFREGFNHALGFDSLVCYTAEPVHDSGIGLDAVEKGQVDFSVRSFTTTNSYFSAGLRELKNKHEPFSLDLSGLQAKLLQNCVVLKVALWDQHVELSFRIPQMPLLAELTIYFSSKSLDLNHISRFLNRLKVPCLKSFIISGSESYRPDLDGKPSYPVTEQRLALTPKYPVVLDNLEFLVIKSPLFVIQRTWLHLYKLTAQIESLYCDPPCFFPRVRVLSLYGDLKEEDTQLFPPLDTIFDLQLLLSLELSANRVPNLDFRKLNALERIEFKRTTSVDMLDEFIQAFSESRTAFPKLTYILALPYTTKWDMLCTSVLNRARDALLGMPVARILDIITPDSLPLMHSEGLSLAQIGEVMQANDEKIGMYSKNLRIVCSACYRASCEPKWCLKRNSMS